MWEKIGELSEIVLAPFLAIAAWFLLFAAGTPNIFTVGVVSFTVGLATKDIIDRLIKFAGNALGNSERK